MAKPERPRDPAREPLGQREGRPDGERQRDDDGDERRRQGAPEDGPGAELGPHGVGHAVGVHDGAVAAAVGPVAAVEEVPAVDPDGRPGLDGQHGDGEHQRRQRQHHGDPRRSRARPAPRCGGRSPPAASGSGGLPIDSACGVAGMLPATPPTDATTGCSGSASRDCATTLEGRGWKLTWDRYDELLPSLLVDRPLQHGADVLRRARAARLVGRDDGVLVVDDRVAAVDRCRRSARWSRWPGVFFTKPAASAAMDACVGTTYCPLPLPSAAYPRPACRTWVR